MTILPKRNKRRFEQRDDNAQQIGSTSGTTQIDVQTNTHPVQLQLQIDPPRSHSLAHSIPQPGHHGGHQSHQQSHSRYNQSNVYHNLIHRTDNSHNKSAVSSENCKWRRSPPMRSCVSDDNHHVPCKKSKRLKAKHKHSSYDSHLNKDNLNATKPNVAGTPPSTPYVAFLPASTSSSTSRQSLIPPQANVPSHHHSPKMPGGAQETSGKGRRPKSPDDHVNSEDEYQNTGSPGGCNSEDEHLPSRNVAPHSEEVNVICLEAFLFKLCSA